MGGKAHGGFFGNASDGNNHPLGFTYDAAGNMTNTSQYIYDPENRIQATAGTGYTYDAGGQRVLKSNSSTGAALKRYWMGNGNVLSEADGNGNLTAEYIYFTASGSRALTCPPAPFTITYQIIWARPARSSARREWWKKNRITLHSERNSKPPPVQITTSSPAKNATPKPASITSANATTRMRWAAW